MSTILDLWNTSRCQKIGDALIEMEQNGFMLDAEYCARGLAVAKADERAQLDTLANACERVGRLRPTIAAYDDVWTSTPQLVELLEKQLRIPPSPYKVKGKVKLAAGDRSTDKRALEWMLQRKNLNAAQRLVLEGVANLRKIRNSMKYLAKFPSFIAPDGFIHPVCGPAGDDDDRVGAITGRQGMKNPEGHQVPKDPKKDRYFIRRAFIAPPGMKLVIADYTALEVVILANICEMLFGDTLLLELTSPGCDIHAYNAHRIFGTLLDWRTDSGRRIRDHETPSLYKSDSELAWYRDLVKAIWYGLMYGKQAYGFGLSLKDKDGEILGETRAQEILDALYEACPSIKRWHDWVRSWLKEHGTICGLDGREINYSDLIARGSWGFEAACRGADNGPMQITGAAVIGCAMVSIVECPELKRLGAKLQLQIHDENQLRAPEAVAKSKVAPLLLEHMENAFPLKNLKSTVGVADNWMEAK